MVVVVVALATSGELYFTLFFYASKPVFFSPILFFLVLYPEILQVIWKVGKVGRDLIRGEKPSCYSHLLCTYHRSLINNHWNQSPIHLIPLFSPFLSIYSLTLSISQSLRSSMQTLLLLTPITFSPNQLHKRRKKLLFKSLCFSQLTGQSIYTRRIRSASLL